MIHCSFRTLSIALLIATGLGTDPLQHKQANRATSSECPQTKRISKHSENPISTLLLTDNALVVLQVRVPRHRCLDALHERLVVCGEGHRISATVAEAHAQTAVITGVAQHLHISMFHAIQVFVKAVHEKRQKLVDVMLIAIIEAIARYTEHFLQELLWTEDRSVSDPQFCDDTPKGARQCAAVTEFVGSIQITLPARLKKVLRQGHAVRQALQRRIHEAELAVVLDATQP